MIAKIFLVDAFAEAPFSGGHASVVFLTRVGPGDLLRRLAGELMSPITIYLLPHGEDFLVRWFTPGAEVNKGVHATLAAAHVVYETGLRPVEAAITFHSARGSLRAFVDEDDPAFLRLAMPRQTLTPAPLPEALWSSLGLVPEEAALAGLTSRNLPVVVLDRVDRLPGLQPDFRRLAALNFEGVAVTAPGGESGEDYGLRFFSPALGLAEDSASGDIQAALGPFWGAKLGKTRLAARQWSRRGARMVVELTEPGQVTVGGRAHTILKADLLLDDPGRGRPDDAPPADSAYF